ncbi:MAG: CBS domain-containing protein [Caulobacteraceae bacterium]|nr:CBS domain-containing protein [Caulobacteraceae bacterium]
MNVRDCMSHDVRLTSPQASIRDAACIMKSCEAGAIPVGENDRLVGIITDRDIALRAVAEGKTFDTPVGEIMSKTIEYVFDDEDLDDASLKMSELKVRRLPVLNRQKRLVGILSLGDIAKGDDSARSHAALSGVSQPGGPHA